MEPKPIVSIIMLSCNSGRFLHEAIESAVAQEFTNWELLIVENASTDNSPEIVGFWSRRDPRIRHLPLVSRITIPEARNTGLENACGTYIATLDSDDIWFPIKLQQQIDFLERAENYSIGVLGGNCLLIDENGTPLGEKTFPRSHLECCRALWYRNPFCHSATLVRRCCFEVVGPYSNHFKQAQDLDLWFRMAARFRLENLQIPLVKYRVWPAGVTWAKYRSVVQKTLEARRLANTTYGYRQPFLGKLYGIAVWLMQWLPASTALRLFHALILRRPISLPPRSPLLLS